MSHGNSAGPAVSTGRQIFRGKPRVDLRGRGGIDLASGRRELRGRRKWDEMHCDSSDKQARTDPIDPRRAARGRSFERGYVIWV